MRIKQVGVCWRKVWIVLVLDFLWICYPAVRDYVCGFTFWTICLRKEESGEVVSIYYQTNESSYRVIESVV